MRGSPAALGTRRQTVSIADHALVSLADDMGLYTNVSLKASILYILKLKTMKSTKLR